MSPWPTIRRYRCLGLRRPAGAGDVVVIPRQRCHQDAVRILLRTRRGAAVLKIASGAGTAFLHRADALVFRPSAGRRRAAVPMTVRWVCRGGLPVSARSVAGRGTARAGPVPDDG
ncbi:SsgA family sporulation/cell division regulator [Streptomyces shenzhenensis]